MPRKVLITGLSSELLMAFAEKIDKGEYLIVGISRKHMPISSGIEWIKGDLESIYNNDLFLQNIEILVHAAALTHCIDPKDYWNFNFEETKKLVNACVKNGVKSIVYISSRVAVEGSGAYGESKLRAEEYIQNKVKNWLIFRPAEIFGGAKNEGIEKLIKDALTKKLVFYPGGNSEMYPIDLKDTAEIMFHEMFINQAKNKIITINGREKYTYKSLIDIIAELSNRTILAIPIPKWLMYVIKEVVAKAKINIGIVPDQIDRFYCKKGFSSYDFPYKPISDYILHRKSELKVK